MEPPALPDCPASASARLSTRLVFFVTGAVMGAWAPLVPYAQARAGLSDGALGLVLLAVGTGSLLGLPLAGVATGRFGCRAVMLAGAALACAALPMLATVAWVPGLVVWLAALGAGVGATDCAMNVQAIAVEKASGRALMSGFHGLYSVGGIAGAGAGTAMLAAGAAPWGAAVAVVGAVAVLLLPGLRGALTAPAAGGATLALPRGPVLLLGVACFVAFLAEGATLDWSAVFLSTVRGVPAAYAGLGFAVFSLTMTAGRLTGDWVVRRLGPRRVVQWGACAGAAGLGVATLAPWWPLSLGGYGLLGAGLANVVPVLFTAVGRQTAVPEHLALPAVATMGYAGILLGPAAIGAAAGATSLSMALLAVAGLLVAVAAGGGRVVRAGRG